MAAKTMQALRKINTTEFVDTLLHVILQFGYLQEGNFCSAIR
jgi:hypothetical protein